MRIHRCGPSDVDELASLCARLWPESSVAEHRAEVVDLHSGSRVAVTFLARDDGDVAVGFAQATVRGDFVNGCDTSPVAFLEGIYVDPAHRHAGVARALCEQVESWGRAMGCAELGSDALLDNPTGHAMHLALGFEERERVVCYRKML